jgi:hypothetical protein
MSPPRWYGQGAGCETPSSEPGCSLTDRWEEDFPLRQEDRALPVKEFKECQKKEKTRSKVKGIKSPRERAVRIRAKSRS